MSAALISSRIGQPLTITKGQFYEMRDSGLVEFCNHTHTHRNLTELAEIEIDEEIRLCEEWLEAHGVAKAKHLVYPFGGQNADIHRIVSRYVHSGLRGNNHIVDQNLTVSSFALNRTSFEETLDFHKSKIDEAVAVNGLIISNVYAHYETFDARKMKDVIDYALSKGMKFSDFSDAYTDFANIIELRDYTGNPSNAILGSISASGKRDGIFADPSILGIYGLSGLTLFLRGEYLFLTIVLHQLRLEVGNRVFDDTRIGFVGSNKNLNFKLL